MLIEIIKAVLMGIGEGITEWLPVSSTGHMILLEQLVHFNASEEFLSMFRVVIQLGAILAVVVLFWKSSALRHPPGPGQPQADGVRAVGQGDRGHPAGAADQPLGRLDGGPVRNHITVAAMLVLYGILFIWVEHAPRRAPQGRPMQIGLREVLIIGIWQALAIIPGTSRSGAHHRGRPAAGPAPGAGGRVHLLFGHSGYGGGLAAQGGQVCAVRRSHHRGRGGRAGWWAAQWPLWSVWRPSAF